jgi:apolipoprotein N-acyltransferase
MRWPVLVVLPLVSALLLILSLPAFDHGALAWVALAPLLFALRQRGAVTAAGLGLLFGWGFGSGTFAWLGAVEDVSAARFLLLGVGFGLYYAAFGFAYALASRALPAWMIVGGPLLWVALEYARGSLGFLALPWNFLAHSQYRYLPVIQIADVTGVYGVSFVMVLVSQVLSQAPGMLARRDRRLGAHGLVTTGAVALTLLYGWSRLAGGPDAPERLRVTLVQANVTPRAGMSVKEQMAHLNAYDRLTMQAVQERPGLVVWPSSSLPGPIGFWMVRIYVNDIARRAGAPLLVGGAGGDKFGPPRDGYLPHSNSEFLISPAGTLEAQYNKVRLTPFNEQVPLQGIVRWPRWVTTLERSFVPGDGYTLFQVSQARFGAPICWESAFADVFRQFVLSGAEFMVSVTNEGAFGETAGPYQTLAMTVFRAVENRVAVARSATTGVSAFIDPTGRIVERIRDANGKDLFVRGVLTWDVPLARTRTFYTRHGDVFAQAATGGAAALLLLSLVSTARRVRAGAPARRALTA